MTVPSRLRAARGQASVELLATLPLVILVVLAVGQLLAAGAAREQAAQAAQAGALALLQGGDAHAAAQAALDDDWRGRSRVTVRGQRVDVVVRPRTLVPGLAAWLSAARFADAGPAT